jgi:periplasmic protein TonB
MEGYVIRPVWLRRPSAQDMRRLYPPQQRGVEALVTADCLVDERGQFSTCEIVKESPAGRGFGESTVRLSKFFKMKPLDADGTPVAGRKLRLPVRWYANLSR